MAKRPSRNSRQAVGYVRRSTDRQEQSIPDQKKAIEVYCREQGLDLVDWYVDDAISGTSTTTRKAFLKMMEDAQSPDCAFSYVVVYDVKRFGRVDNDEAGYYRHLLRQSGVEVLYVSENFNGDETDDLLRPVKQWQARQESKDLSKVTVRGLLSLSEGGWWLGGVPPYGYDLAYFDSQGEHLFTLRYLENKEKLVLDGKGTVIRRLGANESISTSKRDRAKLVLGEPQRIRLVKRIFRLYVEEGMGFKSIAARLNQEKVPAPRNREWSRIHSGDWSLATIRAIITNPLYTGDMVWNRRTDGKFHRIAEGRAVPRKTVSNPRLQQNDEADWVVIPNTHPVIIDRETFERATRRRESRRDNPVARFSLSGSAGRSPYLLSGLVTCAKCGDKYQGRKVHKGKKRKDGSPVVTYYYCCGGYIAKGAAVCSGDLIPKAALEDAVIAAVQDGLAQWTTPQGKKQLHRQLSSQSGIRETAKAKKQVRQRLKAIDEDVARLLDNLTETNRPFVDRRLRELQREKDVLEAKLEELLNTKEKGSEELFTEVWQTITSFESVMKTGDLADKKRVLGKLVKGIRLSPGETQAELELFDWPKVNGILPKTSTVQVAFDRP